MPWDVRRWLSAPPAPSVATRPTPVSAPASGPGLRRRGTAVERRGPTKAAAERALKSALRDRTPMGASGEISADSRVSAVAEGWYAGLTGLSPVTKQAYRDWLDRQILPGLGRLRIRELSVGVLDRHLRLITEKHGCHGPDLPIGAVRNLHTRGTP